MTELLLKLFIKDNSDRTSAKFRTAAGNLASVVSIICNLVLFAVKLFIGKVSMSVSITADAFNNLSDASSNIMSLISFKVSSMPADDEHPYGHARFEYLASMAVAVMIILVSWELAQSGFDKILHPSAVDLSVPLAAALVASLLVKAWMMVFNTRLGKMVSSPVLIAAGADSRNDIISTSAVILGALVSTYLHLNIDGWLGLGVAVFIFISGIGFVRESADLIIGRGVTPEEQDEIIEKIMSYDGILGVHDIMLHDYGAGNRFGSMHCEMDSSVPALISHDLIDTIEKEVYEEMGIYISIHYDPVLVGDERVDKAKEMVAKALKAVSGALSFHDFRMVWGPGHTNLLFDIVVPFGFKMTNEEIKEAVDSEIEKNKVEDTVYFTVINFDKGLNREEK